MAGVRVRLNIGGTRFETSEGTLTKYPESLFGALFSALHSPQRIAITDVDGSVFIDRDPRHLSSILKFLRTGRARLPLDAGEADDFIDELHYYRLHTQFLEAVKCDDDCGPGFHLGAFTRQEMMRLRVGGSCFAAFDLRGVDLHNMSFRGCDLSHAQLQNAKLAGVCFAQCNLAKANLQARRYPCCHVPPLLPLKS